MKNLLYCCLVATAFFFTSCNEDGLFDTSSEVTQATEDQTTYSERTCNHAEHQQSLLSDPNYKVRFDKRIDKMSELARSRSSVDCTEAIVLPIAIHYQNISNPDQECLKGLAQNQVNILNEDFQALNSDASLFDAVANNYPGVVPTNSCIKFCLADQGHPNASGIADGQPAVTINAFNGDNSNTWSGYINVFVRANTGVLGYSPLGGSGNGDGVVIDATAFGSGSGCTGVSPEAPYNLGRTLTHELGHYLLLDHNWGDGGCNSDDGVADTPDQADSNGGCPNAGTSSCGSIDLYMSYMDYTNDACMYMFSNGQAARMNNYVTANFQNMIDNIGNVCSGNTNGGGDNEEGNGEGGGDDNEEGNGEGEGGGDDDNGCYEITLQLNFDDFPEETSWKIKSTDNNQLVASGGNYPYGAAGTSIDEAVCLEDGCYKLIVKDSYGDGMCCDYGFGNFLILDEEQEVFYESDGDFGVRERVDFCIDLSQERLEGLKVDKDPKSSTLAKKAPRGNN